MYETFSAAGIVVSQCNDRLWVGPAGVGFLAGERDFSLFRRIQTGLGAHLASYTVGTGGSFSWGKVTGV